MSVTDDDCINRRRRGRQCFPCATEIFGVICQHAVIEVRLSPSLSTFGPFPDLVGR